MTQNEEFLEKIKQYVLDEDKIVTTTWLAAKLKVRITEAAKLIQTFLTNHRQKAKNELLTTYILSGVHENGQFTVALVSENELEAKRNEFKKIDNESLFSIQKNDCLDLGLLSLVDKFDGGSIEGSVRSKNCRKRVIKKTVALSEVKKEPAAKTLSEPVKKEVVDKNNKPQQKSVLTKKNQSGISSFFTKQEYVSTNQKPKEQIPKNENPEVEEESFEHNEVIDKENTTNENVNSNVKETPKTKKTAKRHRNSTKKNEKPNKRRKRIICHDSDSDDIFGSEKEEMEQEEQTTNGRIESDEESNFIEEKTLPPPPKNKRRKLVDKTYEDENGYMLTTKEWVYESASDEEVEEKNEQKQSSGTNSTKTEKNIEVDKTVKSKDLKETQAKANGDGKKKKNTPINQPTLMDFFKKR